MKWSGRILTFLYKKASQLLFGNSDHADWILEKMQRPGSIWLTCRNLWHYWRGNPRIAGLTAIVIEPVYGCNLRCKTCWGSMEYVKNRPARMPWETFTRIIDHLPKSVESVTFSLAGEPLLHDGIIPMIEYVCKKGVRAILATNGTLLTGEILGRIAASPLSVVNVSVETDPELNLDIRGVDQPQLRKNITHLAELKRPEMEIKLALVAHSGNDAKMSQVKEQWAGLIENIKISPEFKFTGKDNLSACLELWRGNVNILTDGTVMPCCVSVFSGDIDSIIIGNINEQTLIEIIHGERFRSLLAGAAQGNPPPPCQKCVEFRSPNIPRRALKLGR